MLENIRLLTAARSINRLVDCPNLRRFHLLSIELSIYSVQTPRSLRPDSSLGRAYTSTFSVHQRSIRLGTTKLVEREDYSENMIVFSGPFAFWRLIECSSRRRCLDAFLCLICKADERTFRCVARNSSQCWTGPIPHDLRESSRTHSVF